MGQSVLFARGQAVLSHAQNSWERVMGYAFLIR